jgi:signal transduction histidine kinase/CheY-like chemotaxis protein/HPt (histidine-containing phosphotransfer) domain-containing protein
MGLFSRRRKAVFADALSRAIEVFTSHAEKSFEDVMANGISSIAEATRLDRVAIYCRLKTNKKQFGQFYKWDNAIGGTASLDKFLEVLPLVPVITQWISIVTNGECIIRKLSKMSEDEINFSNMFGIKSIMLVPIFTQGEFWGAISFQDHTSERDFSDCKELLHSLAYLCANAVIREEMQRKNENIIDLLEDREKMLETLNDAAITFTSQDKESFEEKMTEGVGLICDIIGLDRLSIWRNFSEPDGLHISQIYYWNREFGGTTEPTPGLKDVTYAKIAPRWEKLLADNKIINGPIELMPESIMLKALGAVSVLVMPLFIKNAFWGFALFEDCKYERHFENDHIKMMRSAAFLCTNVVIRSDLMDNIRKQSEMLEFRLGQQQLISEISKNFVSRGDSHLLIDEALEKLGKYLGVSRILILQIDYEQTDIDITSQWYADGNIPKFRDKRNFSLFDVIKFVFPKNLPENAVTPVIFCSDVVNSKNENFRKLSAIDVASFICVPLYVESSLWGVIVAEYCFETHEWSEDEKSFFSMVSSIISGAIMRDVYVAKLTESLSKVLNLSKAKDDFLSKISHEIRTPMNAILGIAEIQLQDENLPQGVRENLNIIYNSGNSLLRIINDLLDLSKIEARKLEIIPLKYNVSSLISDTAQLNMTRIESKPIEFTLHVSENIPSKLFGDELRIKQILNNILSNAFKYTDKGEVSMRVSVEKNVSKNNDVALIFKVSDTGQGMIKEQVSKIFDAYSRFNLSGNRSIEGTGLGMTITQGLVKLMSGEISVESELGKGSVFCVRLPQKTIAGSGVLGKEVSENLQKFRLSDYSQLKKIQIVREPMPYGKVLIVDDVESNLYVASNLLAPYGLAIETVMSGFEAIEKIKTGNIYDIIFMDHMMPKMDGIETVKIIRDMGYAHIIIALTANAVAGQAKIFLENRFDGFISKPIDTYQLNTALNKHIRDKQTPEIIAEARKQKEIAHSQTVQKIDPVLYSIFVRDAKSALQIFQSTLENIANISNADLNLFAIKAHAIKSAFTNIGENAFSQIALALEKAGKENDKNFIKEKTQELINVLKKIIAKIEMEGEKNYAAKDENPAYLLEQLKVISDACADYDVEIINSTIEDLSKRAWTKETTLLLDKISEHILHSDFDEAASLAKENL